MNKYIVTMKNGNEYRVEGDAWEIFDGILTVSTGGRLSEGGKTVLVVNALQYEAVEVEAAEATANVTGDLIARGIELLEPVLGQVRDKLIRESGLYGGEGERAIGAALDALAQKQWDELHPDSEH